MEYPKFEEKLQQKLISPAMQQGSSSTYGLILGYDNTTNTASIVVARPGSDSTGETYYNVPCPVTMGVQTVAPLPGRPCWVDFKDSTNWFPVVTHYFNHAYQEIDFEAQNRATNNVPRYMYSM